MEISIPTYIINLKARTDRKEHILNEFSGHEEFAVTILDACEHEIGATGLWNSIRKIIKTANDEKLDFVLICEDDHQFTDAYSKDRLLRCIQEAQVNAADILSGGVSWFEDATRISEELFWVKQFSGFQFTIIFKKVFSAILKAPFEIVDAADYTIGALAKNKFFIYPFISIQKDFGYSDATLKNNTSNRVEDLFLRSSASTQILDDVTKFYKTFSGKIKDEIDTETFNNIVIPTYIINLPEREERRRHIEDQFAQKDEFDTTIVNACKHEIGTFGLWLSIRKIIQIAISNDDDVIIICEDDHEFTENYTRELLLQNVLEAHDQGCDIMSGGAGRFDLSVQISKNRFWVSHFLSAQFIVVYRKFFRTILDAPFDETVIGDIKLSQISNHKMLIHPYVSRQKDFGYSDVTPLHTIEKGSVQKMFVSAEQRLAVLNDLNVKHNHAQFPSKLEPNI